MNKTLAKSIVVSLSKPSKMPCKSYSIPAEACHVGSKLRCVPNSTCSDCYACKGMYRFSNVQKALQARLESISNPDWADAMVTLISGDDYFRWHDSGDLQSIDHLVKIAEVAYRTPNTLHWLPTREKGILAEYRRINGELPDNLVVRLSAAMIDGKAPSGHGYNTSTVHQNSEAQGHACPAYKQDGKCGDCRACWDKNIANISYPKH